MHKTGVVHHVIRVVIGEKEMCDVFGQTSRADEVGDHAPAAIKEDTILANPKQISSRGATVIGFW